MINLETVKIGESEDFLFSYRGADLIVEFKSGKNPFFGIGCMYTNEFKGKVVDQLISCSNALRDIDSTGGTWHLLRAESGLQSENRAVFETVELLNTTRRSYRLESGEDFFDRGQSVIDVLVELHRVNNQCYAVCNETT